MALRPGALRRLRRSNGLTFSGLAEVTGLDRAHLARKENEAAATVRIGTARKICQGLLGPDATDDALGALLEELCVIEEEVTDGNTS